MDTLPLALPVMQLLCSNRLAVSEIDLTGSQHPRHVSPLVTAGVLFLSDLPANLSSQRREGYP